MSFRYPQAVYRSYIQSGFGSIGGGIVLLILLSLRLCELLPPLHYGLVFLGLCLIFGIGVPRVIQGYKHYSIGYELDSSGFRIVHPHGIKTTIKWDTITNIRKTASSLRFITPRGQVEIYRNLDNFAEFYETFLRYAEKRIIEDQKKGITPKPETVHAAPASPEAAPAVKGDAQVLKPPHEAPPETKPLKNETIAGPVPALSKDQDTSTLIKGLFTTASGAASAESTARTQKAPDEGPVAPGPAPESAGKRGPRSRGKRESLKSAAREKASGETPQKKERSTDSLIKDLFATNKIEPQKPAHALPPDSPGVPNLAAKSRFLAGKGTKKENDMELVWGVESALLPPSLEPDPSAFAFTPPQNEIPQPPVGGPARQEEPPQGRAPVEVPPPEPSIFAPVSRPPSITSAERTDAHASTAQQHAGLSPGSRAQAPIPLPTYSPTPPRGALGSSPPVEVRLPPRPAVPPSPLPNKNSLPARDLPGLTTRHAKGPDTGGGAKGRDSSSEPYEFTFQDFLPASQTDKPERDNFKTQAVHGATTVRATARPRPRQPDENLGDLLGSSPPGFENIFQTKKIAEETPSPSESTQMPPAMAPPVPSEPPEGGPALISSLPPHSLPPLPPLRETIAGPGPSSPIPSSQPEGMGTYTPAMRSIHLPSVSRSSVPDMRSAPPPATMGTPMENGHLWSMEKENPDPPARGQAFPTKRIAPPPTGNGGADLNSPPSPSSPLALPGFPRATPGAPVGERAPFIPPPPVEKKQPPPGAGPAEVPTVESILRRFAEKLRLLS
jgi:hypothetical protein